MNEAINPDLVTAVIFFGILMIGIGIIVVINLLSSPKKKLEKRINILKARWSPTAKASMVSVRRFSDEEGNKGFGRLLRSLVPQPAELHKRLAKTGLKIRMNQYLVVNVVLTMMATMVCVFFFAFSWPVSILSGICIGMGLPHHVLGKLIRRRLSKFTKLFPDGIDLIVRGLRSGLPVTEAMGTVAQEVEDPVGIEFQQTIDAIKLGRNPDEALADTAERLDTPDFRFFMISLSIQRETGGNLAETLENLSDILRRRQQMKLKIKAMSSEARASAIIIGSLPFIMLGILLLINYEYVNGLFTDPRGMVMLGVGLLLMGTGGAVISKMVRFEI